MLDFEEFFEDFQQKKIEIIAASVDNINQASEFVRKYNLSYSIGYGLNAEETSLLTGAFYDEKDGYLHATGYIVSSNGTIVNGVYSTLAIGRLNPKDCIGLIESIRGEGK